MNLYTLRGDFNAQMLRAENIEDAANPSACEFPFLPESNSILRPNKTLLLKQTSRFIKLFQNKTKQNVRMWGFVKFNFYCDLSLKS